ncbi:sialate O-acetylesterase [Rhodococcus sp. B50]|uniref:sialate O-acetylesterase n=1 Tax=Rhodococcus sp. B50 TaxID=2682847 RepID=UPI0035AC201F|nr:hypothetical protein [Rhodococcus sp. B50]
MIAIFPILGQSNAVGAALDGHKVSHPRVYQWSGGAIVPAAEPLAHLPPVGFGFGTTFGALYAEKYPARQVVLVPCARSGSTLRPSRNHERFVWESGWRPPPGGANMLELAVQRTTDALAAVGKEGHVAGYLWHHGETDGLTGISRGEYARRLRAVIVTMRRVADAPFIMAQMVPEGIVDVPGRIETHHATLEVANSTPRAAFVYSPRNSFRWYKGKPDTTHFNAAGQVEIAHRLLNMLCRLEGTATDDERGRNPDLGPELRRRALHERLARRIRRVSLRP